MCGNGAAVGNHQGMPYQLTVYAIALRILGTLIEVVEQRIIRSDDTAEFILQFREFGFAYRIEQDLKKEIELSFLNMFGPTTR